MDRTGEDFHNDLTLTLPDGRLIGYAEYGDPAGIPVFGFHGMPGSRHMFGISDASGRKLGLRLIGPARPGFGLSSPHPQRTLESNVADIAAVADALGIERFAVAGVSGGGPYATACAALMPERVTALGLVSPVAPVVEASSGRPYPIGLGHTIAFRVGPRMMPLLTGIFAIGRGLFLFAPSIMYGIMIIRCSQSDRKILSRPEVRREVFKAITEGMRPGVKGALQDMRLYSQPWNIPLDHIKAPTFLWQGMSDRSVPVSAALRLGKLIPNCDVTRMEDAGHFWVYDNIDTVLATLAEVVR
jgi:pimeloyl-ACP methyl ester carboxylesterase